jgi:hypothetical protein
MKKCGISSSSLSVFLKDTGKIEKCIDFNAVGLQRKKIILQTIKKLTKQCVNIFWTHGLIRM